MEVGSSNFNPQGGTSSALASGRYKGVVNMLNSSKIKYVDFSMINQNYDNPELTEKGNKTSKDQAPLHIERLDKETMPHIPKGVYKRMIHNPNA